MVGCGLILLLVTAVVVVVVAMVMAVVVVVRARLCVVVMVAVMVPCGGARRPGEQRGRGGGGQDLDAAGSRRADLVDVFEQLVQRRHVHHRLGEGLLGVVVMRDSSPSHRRRCRPLIIGDLSFLWEVQRGRRGADPVGRPIA